MRLFLPGWEGNMSVKWLRTVKVTLPLSEALQSLKVVLAACAASGRAIFSQLSGAASETLAVSLVFLPFDDRLHDWTQAQTGAVINKSVLHFGRSL